MHVVTHLLMGWTLAEHTVRDRRDKALVAWAAVVPDLDGAGLIVDWIGSAFGQQWGLYEQFHRMALHGLPGALVVTALFTWFAQDRRTAAPWVLVSYHTHLVCDVLGSRGGGATDFWPIHYLMPVSEALTFQWNGQWPLTSWQNTTITVVLMTWAIALAIRRGTSPVGLFSRRADGHFVAALRGRFQRKR
jgi:inner membrane protein